MSDTTIATGTPVVNVNDNRGLTVRTLDWNHNDSKTPLHLLIAHYQLDDASRVGAHRDPRQFAAWSIDSTAVASLHSVPSLAGQVLRRESSDSGELVVLFDAAGRPVWTRDGRDTVQTVTYDELGRPASGSEQLNGNTIRVNARSEYGDAGPMNDGSQENNLRGVCVAQYDDGGLQTVSAMALSGAVLSQAYRFLSSAETLPDWPASEAELEAEAYTTTITADARGAMLKQVDAMGHKRCWRSDISGNICYQDVTTTDGEKQILLSSITWNAAGQVLKESAGNGVVTTYGYDTRTQWVSTITAQRTDNTKLQALSYGYDYIGNVTSISDGTVAAGFYRNQATSGTRQFTYDALYQLLNATGRENATNTVMPYGRLPSVLSLDSNQYVAYSRNYIYDDSGNLSTLTHTGAGNFTRTMITETTSNRSVQQNADGPQIPDEVASWFDSNGNLLKLQVDASGTDGLAWDGSDNLQSVTLVNRSADVTQNDRELYQYCGSQRVRKQTRTLLNGESGLWEVNEVRYLPGLELRKSWQEMAGSSAMPSLTEELHVVTGQAGRAGIRVLHWEIGKPDDIANNQTRWSVDDNIGSLSLELDAEGQLISREEYYPFGGTAVWAARSETEASYKTIRYSGKERDGSGLYYYGHRYYAPWLCRWVSADPAGEVDGLNLFQMVQNNPVTLADSHGEYSIKDITLTVISTADRYLTKKTSKFLINRGVSIKGIKRWNRARRTLMLGLAVGGVVAGIATGFGASLAVIGGVFAAGAALGGAVGWFANKLSDAFAGWKAKRATGKSVIEQAVGASEVAAASAATHNASGRGTVVAAIAGFFFGSLGGFFNITKRSMAAANAAGAAVGTLDNMSGGQGSPESQAGAALGGGAAALILDDPKGSSDVGEEAGIGAFIGGNMGKEVDLQVARSLQNVTLNVAVNYALPFISPVIGGAVSRMWNIAQRVVPSRLWNSLARMLAKRTAGGFFEFTGATLGAFYYGAYRAIDIRTEGEGHEGAATMLNKSLHTAWDETTFSRFKTAFSNYFMGNGGRATGSLA